MCIENDLSKIKEIINEIEEKSTDGGYVYRGERKTYDGNPYFGKVSSSLWREYRIEDLDIEDVQQEILQSAKKHIGQLPHDYRPSRSGFPRMFLNENDEAIDFEILTELQHYGGKTNLIDFSTDYFIALFFACNGHHDKDGRIILQKTEEIENIIWYPQNPRHRVVAQKSVFIRHPDGFFKPHEDEIVDIPANLKRSILEHLRKFHSVSTETMYNDLHGFIRNQANHENANLEFIRGFASQTRGKNASTTEEKQAEYKKSVEHYDNVIKLDPEFETAYSNRGEALLHLNEMEKAKADLITAKEMGVNIVASFRNDYESVEEFEQKNNVKLPVDIAEILTPPQA